MNRRFNVIQLSGLKGIFFVFFGLGCAAAGFLIFPGWVCMHIWNFIMSYIADMPSMTLLHGIILWCIIALVTFQLIKKDFGISFKSVSPAEERLKRIIEAKRKELEEAQKAEFSVIKEEHNNNNEEIKK